MGLTLEDRYVDEDFELSKPNFSSCSNLAFGIGGGALANIGNWLDESQVPGFDARCTSDQFDFSTEPVWFSQLDPAVQALYEAPKNGSDVLLPGMPLIGEPGDPLFNPDCQPLGVDPGCGPYGNIIGSENSTFHVPKVTLDWMPTDAVMLYAFGPRRRNPAASTSSGPAVGPRQSTRSGSSRRSWTLTKSAGRRPGRPAGPCSSTARCSSRITPTSKLSLRF